MAECNDKAGAPNCSISPFGVRERRTPPQSQREQEEGGSGFTASSSVKLRCVAEQPIMCCRSDSPATNLPAQQHIKRARRHIIEETNSERPEDDDKRVTRVCVSELASIERGSGPEQQQMSLFSRDMGRAPMCCCCAFSVVRPLVGSCVDYVQLGGLWGFGLVSTRLDRIHRSVLGRGARLPHLACCYVNKRESSSRPPTTTLPTIPISSALPMAHHAHNLNSLPQINLSTQPGQSLPSLPRLLPYSIHPPFPPTITHHCSFHPR